MKHRGVQLLRIVSLLIGICVAVCMTGCESPRVVLVPPGEVIKIGPDTKGKVYVNTKDGWELSNNKVTIPEGWYALPPEDE